MIARFARWRYVRCRAKADRAHQAFLKAGTGMDMNDWERVETRARRHAAFWGRVAGTV